MQPSGYQQRMVSFASTAKYEAEVTALLTGVRAAGPCLDVGCGPGRGTHLISELLEAWVAGVDRAPDARSFHTDRFVAGEMERLPIGDGSVSVVTMIHSLGHALDPGLAVAEAFRVLESGGTLAIVTPNAAYVRLMRPLNVLGLVPYSPDPTRKRVLSAGALAGLLGAAGFADVKVARRGASPPYLPPGIAPERLFATAVKPGGASDAAGRLAE